MSQAWIETWVEVGDAEINGDDLMRVLEPIWWVANFYDAPDSYEESLSGFSRPQRLAYAMTWFDLEVSEGGIDQFLSGPTGMMWRHARAGFEDAGIVEAAAVLEEAERRLGGAPRQDREARCDQLDEVDPDFSDLDAAYATIQDVDLRILHYIRRRAASFRFTGMVKRPASLEP